MASNFIPLFWSKYCQTELQKALILGSWCDYKFEGEFELGNTLKIVGTVKPTIGDYVEGTDISIEKLDDNAQHLEITQQKYFAFYVGKISKAQSNPSYLTTQFDEAKDALADVADKFVGEQAKDALSSMQSAKTDISALTSAIAPLDSARVALFNNDVSEKTELSAFVTPEHFVAIQAELGNLFTNNNEYVKNGSVGKYGNIYIRMSNNLATQTVDSQLCKMEMISTKKAIAFAGQINEIDKCKEEKGFGTIVKGLHVYGAKLVRPKELYVINAY